MATKLFQKALALERDRGIMPDQYLSTSDQVRQSVTRARHTSKPDCLRALEGNFFQKQVIYSDFCTVCILGH
jgi:hypothetical protein